MEKIKKLLLITGLIVSLALLSSCADKSIVKASEPNTVPKVTKVPITISNYFSYKENTGRSPRDQRDTANM